MVHHRHRQVLDVDRELVAEQDQQEQRHRERQPQVDGVAQELARLLAGDGQDPVTHDRARLRAAR